MNRRLQWGCVFLTLVSVAGADETEFILRAADLAEPIRIQAAGKPIDVPGFAAPFVGDFDEDGINDLLVGQLDHGRLRIYRNTGTNDHPMFESFQWFAAGGRLAGVPTGCAVGFTPQLVDYDRDGRTDVVTGSFHGALLYVFLRNRDGSFAEAEVIENQRGDVDVGQKNHNSTLFVHDWDGDDDGDLLIGRSTVRLVENLGSGQAPAYGDPQGMIVDGEPIARGRVPPCVADWDDDGRADLVIGRGSDVVWYRNIATSGTPKLEPARVLVAEASLGKYTEAGPDHLRSVPSGHPYAVCVADFNADGKQDLLLGDHYYLRRPPSDLDSKYEADSRVRRDFWGRIRELVEQSEKATRTDRVETFRAALREWDRLSKGTFSGPQAASTGFQRHGGVWLYLRTDKP